MLNNKNAISICEKLSNNGFESFFVGGAVRDFIMNTTSHDIDITTNALPINIQNIFNDHINTGLKYGTISVRSNSNSEYFEVTTYRIDSNYIDGRHPNNVIFTTSILDDLARRDFTINAIAFNPLTKEYIDPFNGKDDINNKIIRTVGNAKDRFNEDPLRVIRAIRFAIKFNFTISEDTKLAMHDTDILNKLNSYISKERITDELRKILTYNKPIHNIFIEFSDIIKVLFPEIIPCFSPHNNPWHKHNIYEHMLYVTDYCNTDKFEIKLAALFHDIGKPNCRTSNEFGDHFYGHPKISVDICTSMFSKRLKLSNNERNLTLKLIELHDLYLTPKNKSMRKLIINYGEDIIRDLLILKYADIKDHNIVKGKEDLWNDLLIRNTNFKNKLDDVIKNMNAFSIKDLDINGYDIITVFKIEPGPEIGNILKLLFQAVINMEVTNNKNDLMKYAQLNIISKGNP